MDNTNDILNQSISYMDAPAKAVNTLPELHELMDKLAELAFKPSLVKMEMSRNTLEKLVLSHGIIHDNEYPASRRSYGIPIQFNDKYEKIKLIMSDGSETEIDVN